MLDFLILLDSTSCVNETEAVNALYLTRTEGYQHYFEASDEERCFKYFMNGGKTFIKVTYHSICMLKRLKDIIMMISYRFVCPCMRTASIYCFLGTLPEQSYFVPIISLKIYRMSTSRITVCRSLYPGP